MPELVPLWRGDEKAKPKPEQAIPRLEYYNGTDSIWEALDRDYTILLKGSWIMEQSRRPGKVLDSRKHLPEEAFWQKKDMFAPSGNLNRNILSVSHAWRTRTHPDPDGRLLRKLGEVLRPLKEVFGDMAIFIDWCSLFQEPRTEEEEDIYQKSLKDAPTWFLHGRVQKLIFRETEEDKDVDSVVPYMERGWPTFEFYLSFMISQELKILDVSLFDQGCQDFKSTVETCKIFHQRPPPATPTAFAEILKTKHFSKESDRGYLERRYHEAFLSWMTGVKELDYEGMCWDDEQIAMVAQTVRHCSRMARLNLAGNRITAVAAKRLAAAIPRCRRLVELDLQGNPIGQAGEKLIVDSWRKARKPEAGLKVALFHQAVNQDDEQDMAAKLSSSEDEGFYYEGMYKNSMRHGHGTLIANNGFKYEGSFKKGLFHGHGDASFQDGSRYAGQWSLGQKHGEGLYISGDGLRYQGNWECGQRSGQGRQEYEDGEYYDGNWCKGLCSGEGRYVFADGSHYNGLWHKGRYHGPGVMHHNNGICERVEYKNGSLMRREVCKQTGLPVVAAKIGSTTVTCLGKASVRQKREDVHQPTGLPSLQRSKNLIGRVADEMNLTVPRLRPRSASTRCASGAEVKLPLTVR